jgi:hypothetical protein
MVKTGLVALSRLSPEFPDFVEAGFFALPATDPDEVDFAAADLVLDAAGAVTTDVGVVSTL